MRPVAVGLGAHTATLTRLEAEIPSEVPSGVGDVLGELLVFAEVLYKLFGYDPTAPQAVKYMFPGWTNRGRSLGQLKQL